MDALHAIRTRRRIAAVIFMAFNMAWAAACPAADGPAWPVFSGVYPHLAVTNRDTHEVGIGAIMPGRASCGTSPTRPMSPWGATTSSTSWTPALNVTARPESVGGTHADRMIHRESKQMIIGPYFIDAEGQGAGRSRPRSCPAASPPWPGT